ncbi:MAG: GNAT family N-acetyltransferase [Turicibacter sp.]|nr:GNAT family N-acetyltransferase [Turicibacter sp.]
MLQVVNMNRNPLGKEASETYLNEILKKQERKQHSFAHSLKKALSSGEKALENFYFLLKEDEMIGCCGMVIDESAMDEQEKPWITSLYVKEEHRGNNYGQLLLNHVVHKAKLLGYESAYLEPGDTGFAPCKNWVKVNGKKNLVSGPLYYKNLEDQR